MNVVNSGTTPFRAHIHTLCHEEEMNVARKIPNKLHVAAAVDWPGKSVNTHRRPATKVSLKIFHKLII